MIRGLDVVKLPADFYLQDTLTVARSLIGCYLVRHTDRGDVIGRICETEAYIGAVDKACHAYGYRRTRRTEPLFAAGGIAYVYLVYGMYHCLNVVTEAAGEPAAVLLRGAELVSGQELAAAGRYRQHAAALSARQVRQLADGPGKLCAAFGVTRELDRESFLGERLFLCERIPGHEPTAGPIRIGPRVGIAYAEEARDFLWRFYEEPGYDR
jgi:DNA-3-methyladenine glycosylase